MSEIAIVTDSTSDIPRHLAERYGISVVPLTLVHEGVVYRDGIDIHPSQFYSMLAKADKLPTTSQPSPSQFIDVFKPLLESGKQILSFHLSRVLSGTVNSARLAAQQLAPDRIHVVDTGSVSWGLAVQVLEAARLAMQGLSVPAILERIAQLKKHSEVLFTLNTLDYAHKGGRIGKLSSLVGNLLNIKPIARIQDGEYVLIRKVRSIRQAIADMVDFLVDKFGENKVRVAVGHTCSLDYAKMLLEQAIAHLNVVDEPVLFEIGPVIGTYAGPGAVGISVHPVEY
ncbi:MAG TPA: DegV family protein [Oculatellaceae cyanobacterium]